MDPDADVELERALLALQSRGLRARLLASASGAERYAPFADRVARFFGITRACAETALQGLAEPSVWRPMGLPGMSMAAAPATIPGRSMFLRVEPGVFCPAHVHHGEEQLLILEGHIAEDSGLISGPGDLVIKACGSRHSFRVPQTGPCVSAYRIERGVQFS